MSRRIRRTPLVALLGALGFATLLILYETWPGLGRLDATLAAPAVAPASTAGQLLAALALVASPVVQCVALLVLAVWAWTHRLRRLGVTMLAAMTVALSLSTLVKHAVARPRPDSPFAGTLAQTGWSFPSGHVTGATVLALMIVTLRLRQRGSEVRLWASDLLAVAGVAVVAFDRWAMGAHHVSDLAAGLCLGLAVGCGALEVGHAIRPVTPSRLPTAPAVPAVTVGGRPLAHVVYNPVKFPDLSLFRRSLEYELRRHGWGEPVWHETTVADPGTGPARLAVAAGAGLVVAAGGDGTVRAVCEGLLGGDVPLAVVPSGTGNILAHNLGLPLDQEAAFAIALDGTPRPLDLVRLRAPGFTGLSTVMSGMGIDAAAMAGTRPDLKKLVGNAAYVWSIVQQLRGEPFDLRVTLDGHEPVTRSVLTAMIGNVGGTQTPIQLFPAARPDDGLLDLMLWAPASPLDFAKTTGAVLAGSVPALAPPADPPHDLAPGVPDPLEYAQAATVRFDAARPVPFQIDGDAIEETTWLEAEILPGAVRVMTRG
ncbi:MAG: phosphatase PAP2 family protein [Propionibacteriaceae bacterium]|nr:phosphatase PAP2 family protein [Propionibacteriaceae bacterium]